MDESLGQWNEYDQTECRRRRRGGGHHIGQKVFPRPSCNLPTLFLFPSGAATRRGRMQQCGI